MARGRLLATAGLLLGCLVLMGAGLSLFAGRLLTAPALGAIGSPPFDLPIRPVEIPVSNGQRLSGWHTRSPGATATVLLFHSLRASRAAMLGRARFLQRQGFDWLAVDFRAHGESDGGRISFGPNEAEDVAAAVAYVRAEDPRRKIGVIGVSLGGAAALLNGPALAVDALVAEAPFADLVTATENRLRMRFGAVGPWLSPLLTWQIPVLLGFDPREYSPERAVSGVRYPVLLIYGSEDRRATPAEGLRLAAAIGASAQLWWVEGASHLDLHAFSGRRYEERVLAFLARHLR